MKNKGVTYESISSMASNVRFVCRRHDDKRNSVHRAAYRLDNGGMNMILIYDEDCDIKVGETLTIEWVGGESN